MAEDYYSEESERVSKLNAGSAKDRYNQKRVFFGHTPPLQPEEEKINDPRKEGPAAEEGA